MKRFLKKNILLILSLALVFALVGSTYAYLVASDGQIINRFKLARIDTSIKEQTGDYGVKKVSIQNDDISSVYVRARVLVSAGDVGAYFDPTTGFVDYDMAAPDDTSIHVWYNSTDWAYDSATGWFYYLHVLPGKTDGSTPATPELIYKVIVGGQVQPAPENAQSFEVDVYEESVLTSDTSADVAWGTVEKAFASKS